MRDFARSVAQRWQGRVWRVGPGRLIRPAAFARGGGFRRRREHGCRYRAIPFSDGLRIGVGMGNGAFRESPYVPLGFGCTELASADFNGDGLPDLAVTCPGENRGFLLLNTADGEFDRMEFGTGTRVEHPVVGDFTGDGRVGIAVEEDNWAVSKTGSNENRTDVEGILNISIGSCHSQNLILLKMACCPDANALAQKDKNQSDQDSRELRVSQRSPIKWLR